MLRFFLGLFDRFGMDVLQIGIICYGFWKIATNHLAHIAKDIKANAEAIERLSGKVDASTKETSKVAQRVSKLEGKMECFQDIEEVD